MEINDKNNSSQPTGESFPKEASASAMTSSDLVKVESFQEVHRRYSDTEEVEFNVTDDELESKPEPASGTLNPNQWMNSRFPSVYKTVGQAFLPTTKNERWAAISLNEDFFAMVFGPVGNSGEPIVYYPSEDRFFKFDPAEGIYVEMAEEHFRSFLSMLLYKCVQECRSPGVDTSKLEYTWRSEAKLGGVVGRAKSRLAVEPSFFETSQGDEVICKNGIFSLKENRLLPFSPSRRFRNKLGVSYVHNAECPRFLEFINGALDAEDVDLFQRWSGQALIGVNHSQSLMNLTGTAGGGKSTLVNIVEGIIGKDNVAMLRTKMLGERFEFSLYVGKTLLRGNDVPINFLDHKSASFLKSLVGADSLHAEIKNGKRAVQIQGSYNILVTSNARLKVHLEGDEAAWRRRLVILAFSKAAPAKDRVIPNLDKVLLASEAPGILRWMIEGLRKLQEADWQLRLTKDQQRRVEDILEESNSVHHFGKAWLSGSKDVEPVTAEAVYQAYLLYCEMRGWKPLSRPTFGGKVTDWIATHIGATESHDIKGADDKPRKGWRGLAVKGL